ncbi:AP2 domain-containing protein [Terrihalobacillus insolitus]|uniref:AP2 domain-containing protein n=1 Tax=Terrihalobacillus insolitus TaxID=2950438 RepID=UPI00234074C0|nr:AP2 domain-containing protein [Terrihalobacillus insolitus]MDC3413929.1 HNH endonuclease [Terrihalobacillus insolitus]
MKNKFEVHGDVTVIFLRHKGELITTLISTEDLPRVSSISGSWYAMDVGGKRGKKVYAGTSIGGVTVYLHQVIAMNPPKTVVDHINHCTLDNRRQNLRITSYAKNGQNRKGAQKNNVNSGCRNVYRNSSGNWFVRLVKNGKTIHCGTYKTVAEANAVAVKARRKIFQV